MHASPEHPLPVREAFDDVVGTSRTLLLQRMDLLQLEAEHLVEDAAVRLSEASAAIVLGSLALLTGTVAVIAWGTPKYGLASSSGLVALAYGLAACIFARHAQRRRRRRHSKASS